MIPLEDRRLIAAAIEEARAAGARLEAACEARGNRRAHPAALAG